MDAWDAEKAIVEIKESSLKYVKIALAYAIIVISTSLAFVGIWSVIHNWT